MEIDILRIDKNKKEQLKDIITEEIPLTLYLNEKELVTLLCSPDSLKELSIGFLFSSGLIKSIENIDNITIDAKKWSSHIELKNKADASELIFKRVYTSGCGKGTLFYKMTDLLHRKPIRNAFNISSEKISELMRSFQERSVNFRKTGGVHSAELSDGKDIVIFKEDIGRHNAIDKIIGEALIKGLNLKNMIVLTSGRISSEIVFKVQKMASPILISRSAPTDQAVKIAKELNLTLVGFARGKRMNVYTARERIV